MRAASKYSDEPGEEALFRGHMLGGSNQGPFGGSCIHVMRLNSKVLLSWCFPSWCDQTPIALDMRMQDGWSQFNRTDDGSLQPSTDFTNGSMADLTAALHARGFRFGIYTAAGYTTCGRRAGTLYHEFADAARFKAWGVDYLKYDDCGEANIQSYAKYFVMKDALAVAYASSTPIDYYSYEPFQVYGNDAVRQMAWVSDVGDLWRTGGDIRAEWRSVLANAHANNEWAPNSRPGHFNDADMLEVRWY